MREEEGKKLELEPMDFFVVAVGLRASHVTNQGHRYLQDGYDLEAFEVKEIKAKHQ